MNKNTTKFSLTGDKFMPEINLRQREFTYRACESFTKTKNKYKNLKKQEIRIIFNKMN